MTPPSPFISPPFLSSCSLTFTILPSSFSHASPRLENFNSHFALLFHILHALLQRILKCEKILSFLKPKFLGLIKVYKSTRDFTSETLVFVVMPGMCKMVAMFSAVNFFAHFHILPGLFLFLWSNSLEVFLDLNLAIIVPCGQVFENPIF